MYVPPAFRIDRAESLAFAAAQGFGLVIACDGARPVASPIPFVIDYRNDGTPVATFHLARGNPLADLAAAGGDWMIAVTGAHAYVSPDWYESPDQVPTWLYQAVHLSGPVRVRDKEALPGDLDRLAERFETGLAPKPQWQAATVTPGRRQMLMKAIVGLEITIERIDGSFKLNQHKSDADHVGVSKALAAQDYEGARTVAAQMVALRPQLAYDTDTVVAA